jgi:hypothetical protein
MKFVLRDPSKTEPEHHAGKAFDSGSTVFVILEIRILDKYLSLLIYY